MKNQQLLILVISAIIISPKINSQVILDHNNVSARVSPYGTYFNNFIGGIKGYEVPKGIGFSSIFGVQSVFGAKDNTSSKGKCSFY